MLLLTQVPNGGALSSKSILPFSNANPNSPLFSKSRSKFSNPNPRKPLTTLAGADSGEAGPPDAALPLSPPTFKEAEGGTVFVGYDGVPLEGVIQFEKPDAVPSKLVSSAQVGLLAGGDVLCPVLFSAIGRFSHGLSVVDFKTLRTADPFIAVGHSDQGRDIRSYSSYNIYACNHGKHRDLVNWMEDPCIQFPFK